MRIALLTLLNSISISVWAGPTWCGDAGPQHADLLTTDQWKAVLSEQAGSDPVLEGALAVERHKYSTDIPNSENTTPIEWTQVRKLVLLGAVKRTFEGHALAIFLVTISGRRYSSREPHAGDLGRLTDVVDPCGVYIHRVLE
jgi:hypothetical protein